MPFAGMAGFHELLQDRVDLIPFFERGQFRLAHPFGFGLRLGHPTTTERVRGQGGRFALTQAGGKDDMGDIFVFPADMRTTRSRALAPASGQRRRSAIH